MAATTADVELPLFPLASVLFPGGRAALRVFEPRYLDLVRECARGDRPFGVCLILAGQETGDPALPAAVGTLAYIRDFHRDEGGLLVIEVEGGARFQVLRTRTRHDGLIRGEAALWPDEAGCEVPVEFALLQGILERMIELMAPHWRHAPRSCYDDASWLGLRLAELLPLDPPEQQRMLELTDPVERLASLRDILPRFQKA